jgi:hypothetical protein
LPSPLPDILLNDGSPALSVKLSRWAKAGQIRRVLPGVYTSDLAGTDEDFIRRHWAQLITHKYPGALLSHRSALEYQPSAQGIVYLTHDRDRVVRWPGLTLKFVQGPAPEPGDRALIGGLAVSGEARALLENLTTARRSDGERRTVDRTVLEERLLRILEARGEQALNALRDEARVRSNELGLTKEFAQLDALIGALLATREAGVLGGPAARAWAAGEPYDTGRIALFDKLLAALLREVFPVRLERTGTTEAFRHFAFFESYFSNYIEGTEFEVAEAADIIYRGVQIPNRTGDSHDIRGTFEVCAERAELHRVPRDGVELIELLRARHATVLRGRPDKSPGAFKERPNRAGDTSFVGPGRVVGTLKVGFERMAGLADPLARALYMMFLVSEVHPFTDGNGRIARIMMNAELVHAGHTRIIVPNVYREDYLLALRRLTRQQDTAPYIRMMQRAHAWSHWLEPISYDHMHRQMLESNAYREPDEARLRWADQ